MGRLTLALGILGLACTAIVLVSQADSVSPFLALPIGALAAASVAPRVGAIAMCLWCCLAAASVGVFLAPCAAAMIVGARRDTA
ncbi:MAG: hypothetical protein ACJ74C_12750 [Gaiellaceae bacterium]